MEMEAYTGANIAVVVGVLKHSSLLSDFVGFFRMLLISFILASLSCSDLGVSWYCLSFVDFVNLLGIFAVHVG